MDIPDQIQAYYEAKALDVPTKPSTVSDLLHKLDDACRARMYHDGPHEAIETAFDAVLAHPESTWTSAALSYRLRQLHYS